LKFLAEFKDFDWMMRPNIHWQTRNCQTGHWQVRGWRAWAGLAALALAAVLPAGAGIPDTNAPLDLTRGLTLYEIGYSHLDTQWRWTYPQVIHQFIANTINDNALLFEKYPDYIFNWTGANRYHFMQEYFPADFERVRGWVAAGRWWPAGSSWEENDVNSPSSESLIRQLLYGHNFFEKEFGTESSEYMLPDCFGFPASLPSVLAHCGLRGFSTQKLTWGSAVGIPYNLGVWEGPDGQSVIAALNAGDYTSKVRQDLSTNAVLAARIQKNGETGGIYADYQYYGEGDRGGAPDGTSVKWIEKSLVSTGAIHVVSARTDQLFNAITDAEKARLPRYKGDLELTEHSAGSITSQAYMKRWNRENELLANAAEGASVAAWSLGLAPYPREKLTRAWELVLGGQFHDILPGTCIPKAYEYSWNDEVIALNSFAEVLQNAVGAVAEGMDTRSSGTPLVVYNPLGIDRTDVVTAELPWAAGTPAVQVFDGKGRAVPTQMLAREGDKASFLFLAQVPSVGFAVFDARPGAVQSATSALKVTERTLENARYRVTLNDAGDLASVYDKAAGRELLSSPARLAFLYEKPRIYPAWNTDWVDRQKPPLGYVDGPATFTVVENGPVRVALRVERQARVSTFAQTYRLSDGPAADHVEVACQVEWQSHECCVKADFPLAVTNDLATYNWDLGKIARGNNDPKKYEVPSHQWFDLTDRDGSYGVSILNDAKYGSDKPTDNELRLTLLRTPGVRTAYQEQQWQDWGKHEFVYGLYGHAGDWRQGGSDWQSARLGQPLLAFRTAPHPGRLGREYCALHLSDPNIAVRALKLAEDRDEVIVRLQELNGKGSASVKLQPAVRLQGVTEVNGLETPLHPDAAHPASIKLAFGPYQLRSLALHLAPPDVVQTLPSASVALPYDVDGFSYNVNRQDGSFDLAGATIPAEMMGDTVVAEGIPFHIGPRADGQLNTVACHGQTLALPSGDYNRVYLLAAAVQGDTTGTFTVAGQPVRLAIQDWSGYIGQWDNRVFQGPVEALTYSVTNALDHIDAGFIKRAPLAWFCSHRHLASGLDDIYAYSYLYKYHLDLPPGARTLTLPDNPGIRIVAATVARNHHDDTVAVQPLYDDFTGRTALTIKPERLTNNRE
jgi:alpha-mannosidase